MKRKVRLLFGILAALVVVAFIFHDDATTTTEVTTISEAVEAGAGYQAAIDPATRTFVEPTITPADAGTKSGLEPLNTSSHGLVEEPSPVAGGGVMVDLRGRFQNTFTATANPAGELVIECDTDNNTNGEGE